MDMIDGLTRENLHGVWLALTTPFTPDDRIDIDAVRENVRRCRAVGLHGVYTTDSDGEFYAIELDDFETLIEAFGAECGRAGHRLASGCDLVAARAASPIGLRVAAAQRRAGRARGPPDLHADDRRVVLAVLA